MPVDTSVSTGAPRTFVIFALPRSRTAWLSRFLTYGDWNCGHDEGRHARSLDDIRSWLSLPNTGTAETSASPFWRTLKRLRPDARVVVIRRQVSDVIGSLDRLGFTFDRPLMERTLQAHDAKLAQIVRRWPNAIQVSYDELASEATCARVFEFCLPYNHDPIWWEYLDKLNIQAPFNHYVRYLMAFGPQVRKLVSILRHQEMATIAARTCEAPSGFTFQIDTFDKFLMDSSELFKDHLVTVGECPENVDAKNIPLMRALDQGGNMQIVTARSNGRVFGYLMTVISPSLHSRTTQSAIQTAFYASPEAPGLGLKLQRYSLRKMREAGRVDEVFLFAGFRGSGAAIGSLFKRVGAQKDGEFFRLVLRDQA